MNKCKHAVHSRRSHAQCIASCKSWCHVLWCGSWLVVGVDMMFSPPRSERRTPEWTVAPPPDPPTAQPEICLLIGQLRGSDWCRWSVSILLTRKESREKLWIYLTLNLETCFFFFFFCSSFPSEQTCSELLPQLVFFIHVFKVSV